MPLRARAAHGDGFFAVMRVVNKWGPASGLAVGVVQRGAVARTVPAHHPESFRLTPSRRRTWW